MEEEKYQFMDANDVSMELFLEDFCISAELPKGIENAISEYMN